MDTYTFTQYAEKMIGHKELEAATIKTYRAILGSHVGLLGDLPVDSVRLEHVLDLRKSLKDAQLKPTTIKNALRFVCMVLTFAHKNGRAPEPPQFRDVRGKFDAVATEEPFSREEIALILAQINDHYKPLFTVWALTGCRPSELAALRWSDLDFKTGRISISKAIVARVEKPRTKTGKSRSIPMLSAARVVLEALPRTSEFVFTAKEGGPIHEGVSRLFKTACKRAGVDPRRSYLLRHAYAMNSLRGGVPLSSISALLGHSRLSTTIGTYLRNCRWEETDILKLEQAHAG